MARIVNRTGPISPDRLSRALTLLRYLTATGHEEPIPVAEVEKDLAVSREEIRNDLQLLNLANYGGGTYLLTASMDEKYIEITREPAGETLAEPTRLSPMMARAVLLALDLMEAQLAVKNDTPLESVRRKVETLAPDPHDQGSVAADDLRPPDTKVARALARSVEAGKLVSLEYYTPAREQLTTRKVEPYLLFRTEEAWYLEAYCLTAEAQRTFRLDRIRSVEPTSQAFTPRDDVDLSFRGDPGAPFIQEGCEWALLRYFESHRTALEDAGIIPEESGDGSLKGRVPYLDNGWLVRYVLTHGGSAVLEEPRDLRREVAQAAEQLLESYRAG